VHEPIGPIPLPPTWNIKEKLLNFTPPKSEEILSEINYLQKGRSPGPDVIPTDFLIGTKFNIVKPLQILFTESLRTGELPRAWKLAIITPLFKSGNREDVSNYRPVSLTSSIGKLLEKIVYKQIWQVLQQNGILINEQFGFCSGRSVNLQLLDFVSYLIKNIN